MSIFTGAGVALITPMNPDGSINYPEMEHIINDQIAGGTDAVIVCGTTGETATMTYDEHIETIRACVQMTAGRIPVIAGTGSNCTKSAVKLSVAAERAGADGLLVVSPYYNKATQNGIKAHYKQIAAAVDLPILMYNIKGRTGVNIAPRTIVDLVQEVPNIVGVKEASGDLSQIADIMARCDGEIDLYSGNDDQIVPIVALGGKGVISVLSHVAPRDTHDMVIKMLEGDTDGARRLQLKYIPLIHALFCEVNPIPVKAAMNMLGYQAGPLRMPLTEMEEEHQETLREAMRKAGLDVKHAGEVNDLAKAGNEVAKQIMDDAKEYLANFIGVVYGYADPEIVILGGSVALKIDDFVEEVEALAKERVYEIMKPYVKVRKSTLNEDSGLIGAAYLAFSKAE